MEQTVNIELTQEQFNHVKEILAQSKPSRSRLTQEEKGMIRYICNKWLEDYSGNEEDDKLINSILKKLTNQR